MTPEQFRTLYAVLSRIADAFEERNLLDAENKAKNEKLMQHRREELMELEREKIEIERQVLALHKLNATREQNWRKEQNKLIEQQTREITEQNNHTYENWLSIMEKEREKVVKYEPTVTKWNGTDE